jgi:hypothetical protein
MGVSSCLDVVSIESLNLDVVKEWVSTVEKISTVEKSRLRSRLLDFVWTSMSRPKSLDREIHRDLKISRSRSAWIFVFSRQDFSIRHDFSSFSDSKGLDNVEISQKILTKISMCQSLNWKVSILKISTKKKKRWSWHDGHSRRFSKVSLNTKDVLNLDIDWSRLSRPPCL